MTSFDWKKSIEDFIKDRLIITATTTRIFFELKAANIKPPKASLDAMDIMKLTGGICGGVFVKDYAVYKKWINERYNNKNFMAPKGNKIKLHELESVCFVLLILRSRPTRCATLGWYELTSRAHFTFVKALQWFFNSPACGLPFWSGLKCFTFQWLKFR